MSDRDVIHIDMLYTKATICIPLLVRVCIFSRYTYTVHVCTRHDVVSQYAVLQYIT